MWNYKPAGLVILCTSVLCSPLCTLFAPLHLFSILLCPAPCITLDSTPCGFLLDLANTGYQQEIGGREEGEVWNIFLGSVLLGRGLVVPGFFHDHSSCGLASLPGLQLLPASSHFICYPCPFHVADGNSFLLL